MQAEQLPLRQIPTPIRMVLIKNSTNNPGEGVKKREPSYIVDGNITLYSHYGEHYSKKKKNTELPHDSEITLPGIYPEKNIVQKDTYTSMFIAALFTIANAWKHFKCPSTEEWIKM